jgi:hypothetical protein
VSGVGDRLDQRRLTGTIVTDHRQNLARKQVNVDTIETDHTTEGLDQSTAR